MENKCIKVEVIVKNIISKVWDFWTQPEHIKKWNLATEEWHCPDATTDFKVGGIFNYRMEAKDESMKFDFTGKYSIIITNERISYNLEDGRKVNINFIKEGVKTKVIESFELDSEGSEEIQKQGWQAILNNFKKYAESS